MAKIVQFEDGKYGVRAYWIPIYGWHFVSRSSNNTFWSAQAIDSLCKFDTINDAERAMRKYVKLKKPSRSTKHRVINRPPPSSSWI